MKRSLLHITLFLLLNSPIQAIPVDKGFNPAETDTVTVYVLGTQEDSRFEPAAITVRPGDVVRFSVQEGMHTVTAYHPDNRRELGIPEGAESFDSGILQRGDNWFLTITHEGEYNYFCLPHEQLGHTGTILSTLKNFN